MGGRTSRHRTIAALVLGATLLGACTSSDGTASTTTTGTTSTTSSTTGIPATARAAVDALMVAQPPTGLAPYRRDAFGNDWAYDPTTGCNTRERVLIAESLATAVVDDRCHPSSGKWVSGYDGVTTTDPTQLQIDHLIPLADAWRSGAAAWTADRRLAFANDLTSPETLLAVTGSTNESKGDRTPDQWMPPNRRSWCSYATSWVDVKHRWGLTVTPAEKAALVQILSGC